jgi:hypothetical protein
MRARRVIERLWSWLGEDQRPVEILVVLLLCQLITMLLPQSPFLTSQSPAFTQWVAQLRPVLGNWAQTLSLIGLLNIRSSLLFRIVLAFLGLLIAVRIDMVRASWDTLRNTKRRMILLFCIGGMLIIAGWVAQILWGWAVPEVINWPNTPIVIAEHSITLSARKPWSIFLTEKYGTYLIRTGWAVGLNITAFDENGQSLPMLRSTRDELQDSLQVVLSGSPPEAFFLVPDTQLVYRLHQIENKHYAPVFVQVYRSASGELLAEVPFHGPDIIHNSSFSVQVYRSASGELLAEVPLQNGPDIIVETTRISMNGLYLPRYRVVYNPGAPIEGVGLVLLLVCVLMRAKRAGEGRVDGKAIQPEAVVNA